MRDSIKPIMGVGRTSAQISDPLITFEESGVTFDDSRYTFGGVYGFTDSIKPRLVNAYDFGTSSSGSSTTSDGGMSMGLLLALTYP